jgi:hypothetical protein
MAEKTIVDKAGETVNDIHVSTKSMFFDGKRPIRGIKNVPLCEQRASSAPIKATYGLSRNWGRHLALCKLLKTQFFSALRSINGSAFTETDQYVKRPERAGLSVRTATSKSIHNSFH